MEYLSLVLRGVLSLVSGKILITGALYILRQHPELPRLPSIQAAVGSEPDFSGGYHV